MAPIYPPYTPMIVLPTAQGCAHPKCSLGANTQHKGIAGRPINLAGTSDCVLFVGQSPGVHEDERGQVFIGRSGKLLEKWYVKHLDVPLDIWATNAVKCIPPYKTDPTLGQVKACRSHLWDDIATLQQQYERVWVICLGRTAAQAVLGVHQLRDAFSMQGRIVAAISPHAPFVRPITVFATQHPAALLRNPKDTLACAIKDHLRLAHDSILDHSASGGIVVPHNPAEFLDLLRQQPSGRQTLLSVDIETYGIRPWNKQTVFHPEQSRMVDKVPIDKQIESISFSCTLKDGSPIINTTAYLATDPQFQKLTEDILFTVPFAGHWLVGTNLLFDLTYLRARFPSLRWQLEPAATRLLDLCVAAFMQNPDRPELSLKDLTPLLLRGEYAKYEEKGHQYADDKELLLYNQQDTINPLRLLRVLVRRMLEDGLPPSPWWLFNIYSDLMHTLLHMTEVGVCLDQEKLAHLFLRWHGRVRRFEGDAGLYRGTILSGKGSQKSVDELFNQAVAEAPTGTPWELSERKGKVSTSKGNMRRALALPLNQALKKKLRTLRHYRSAKKLVSSYLEPLLVAVADSPLVFPHWFPVPSRFDEDRSTGGTRQGRITCKKPALQTAPKLVQKCYRSRFWPRGVLLGFDYSQLELRLLALMSGDEAMLRVYDEDRDLHQETLDAVMQRKVDKDEPGYDTMRRKAKNCNFGVVYGITAGGLKDLWWDSSGIEETSETAARFIAAFMRAYPKVPLLHRTLTEEVQKTGRLVLPVTGQWLSFADPRHTDEMDRAIINFPIQAMAGILGWVAQGIIIQHLNRNALGVSPLNVYDRIDVDLRSRRDEDRVCRDVAQIMTDNWYIRRLFEHFNRTVKLKVDCKVLAA